MRSSPGETSLNLLDKDRNKVALFIALGTNPGRAHETAVAVIGATLTVHTRATITRLILLPRHLCRVAVNARDIGALGVRPRGVGAHIVFGALDLGTRVVARSHLGELDDLSRCNFQKSFYSKISIVVPVEEMGLNTWDKK